MKNPFPLSNIIFGDLAAFYAIRQRGIGAAVREIIAFRKWAATTLSAKDILILESSLPQNLLLIPRRTCPVLQVARVRSAYEDRERVLQPYLGELPFAPCVKPGRRARRVLINPSARARSRNIPIEAVAAAIRIAAEASAEVCLIDVDGRYDELRPRVHDYMARPTLTDAAKKLRDVDAYIGPDSFFMHLAYYFRVPFLAFFWPNNIYFAPPGMLAQGNFVLFPNARNESELSSKVRQLLMPAIDLSAGNN